MIPFLRPSAWRPWIVIMALMITGLIAWASKNVVKLGALSAILLLLITVLGIFWRIYHGRWRKLLWSRHTKEGFVDTSKKCRWKTETIGLGKQAIWLIVGQGVEINYEGFNLRFLPPFLNFLWPETHESFPVIKDIESLTSGSPNLTTEADRTGIGRDAIFEETYNRGKEQTLWLKVTLSVPCQIEGRISFRTKTKGHRGGGFAKARCRIKVRPSHST